MLQKFKSVAIRVFGLGTSVRQPLQFTKVVQQFDDLESSREGAGSRDTAAHLVRKHLEDIGLDGDIAQYNEISGLSGGKSPKFFSKVYVRLMGGIGQKIKLVIAACLWNNPQVL